MIKRPYTEPEKRNKEDRQGLLARYQFHDIIGESTAICETIREARKYALSEATVLITGESGTGKELFAQSMHNESPRKNGPFVAVNCAALPEALLESELFGYEEGAFTGARKGGKQGLFVLAHRGTILLDEIGDLSPTLQARLLRVLQQKEVMPLGGQRVIPIDVRVISATNRNLLEAVERGAFRVDLFYRLNVLHLHIPPLRSRPEDLPLLFTYFYRRLTGDKGNHATRLLTPQILDALQAYNWPGNVRELEGLVERYVALGETDGADISTLRRLIQNLKRHGDELSTFPENKPVLKVRLGNMEDMERQIIEQAARITDGNKSHLAKIFGLSRTTLWRKLKKMEQTEQST